MKKCFSPKIYVIHIRYLVDQSWLKQWKKYTGYDSWDQYHAGKDSVHPGPVDNTKLFEGKLCDLYM